MVGVSISSPQSAEEGGRGAGEPGGAGATRGEEPGAIRRAAPRRREPIAWRRLALPVATLAAAGVSLVLFVRTLAMTQAVRDTFFTANALPAPARDAMTHALLIGGGVPVLATVIALVLGRGRAVSSLERMGRLLGPLVTLCLLPALFNVRFAHSNQLIYVVVLGTFVLMLEPLLRRSFAAAATFQPLALAAADARALGHRLLPPPRIFFFVLVVLASAGYAAYVAHFTIMHHHRLGTTAFDLGIYDNLMYQALHGRPFVSPVLFGPAGGNYIAGHAEFAMLLFVPFYAIRPGPETMLIIQAVVLGFAAVPLYLFAATRLPRPTAALVALAYLLFAPLHGPNFYDFHWIPLAIFFHFWLYYAIAQRKTWLIVAMILVLFAIREDVAVGLAMLGLFLLFTGLRPRLGMILAVASVAWFVIVRFIIMPLAGGWYFQNLYAGLFADGNSSFVSVVKTIITNPVFTFGTLGSEAKLTYVGHMFVPLAMLPWRRALLLPLAAAGIFFTILTTGYSPTIQISFQYTTHWIPYLFLGTVLALILISRQGNGATARRAAAVTLGVAVLAHSYNFGAFLQHETFIGGFSRIEFKMNEYDRRRYRELKELLAMIPPDASVAATEQETAHVSTRKVVYPLRVPPGPVDYLLIGRSHVGDLSKGPLEAAMANNDYGLVAERGEELFLFKRGHVSPQTAAARRKLGLP